MIPDDYRAKRLALGDTQAELAEKLGLPREAIVRREAGAQRIPEEAVIAINALRKKKTRGTKRR